MYANFTFHDAKSSQSSSKVFQYLDKENKKEKSKNQDLILEGKEINPNTIENFFNQDFNPYDLNDINSQIDVYQASLKIDKNRGTQNLSSSNFYMINISPSKKEIEHMETIAIDELKNRGLNYDDIKNNDISLAFYEEQKDQLMKLQMKLYVTDVMNEYARMMDREIYANQEKLPTNNERKVMQPEIDQRFKDFLYENGIEDLEEKDTSNFIKVNAEKINENSYGTNFNIYVEEIDKKIDLLVPNNKFSIEGDQILIDQNYLAEKREFLLDEYNKSKELISIDALEVAESNDEFKDFIQEDKIKINYDYSEFDVELSLYFDKSDVRLDKGKVYIPQNIYDDKLYEVKSKFLAKEFKDKRELILNNIIKSKGFDISKEVSNNGEEVYINPNKVPTKEDMKTINILCSVEFNKFLTDAEYLPQREKIEIHDWDSKIEINSEVLAESNKAKLLLIEDPRLSEPKQVWIGNFVLSKDDKDNLLINSDFYNQKINQLIGKQKEISFIKYREIEGAKVKKERGESIAFSFDVGLKELLKFNIKKEDLFVDSTGNYTIENGKFQHKYEQNLINQCKQEFKKEYTKIVDLVNENNIKEKDFIKNSKIEKNFKDFLQQKGILQLNDDKYFINSKVEETTDKSYLISLIPPNYDNEIKLWVNQNLISDKNNQGIFFTKEREINKLINNAIERDKEQKKLVEINYDKITLKDIKEKEGREADIMITFEKKIQGLEDPIKFTFKESELRKQENTYFVENFKLDYRIKKAKDLAIRAQLGDKKEEIKNEVWKKNGFDTTKRKVTGKDLLYFAKVETERTYNHKDKSVLYNRPILSKIKEYKESQNPLKTLRIGDLEKQLLRDKYTGEVIEEGTKKGGQNYHSHVIVSRHDQTSINPRDKVSMSPVAHQREGVLNNGAKVGFNRDDFFKSIEHIFDEKYEYNRPEKENYVYLNNKNNNLKKIKDNVKGLVKGEVKKHIMEHTGINAIKNEINPIQKAKQAIIPIPIPTSFPKNKIDMVVKVIKLAKNLVVDKGIQY